ncbi:Alcohol dehydrogenase [Pseudonocardia sp. Ae717_Ps2]|uniref:zinc-dependent alcohol dehydrogenase n=1 Tax=Pseudonocardia sp. Ae717_Ps2 TaxID=1885573 RepID=UPI00094B37C1|nr:zinc-binding dehydrogenase [Pseudonocardia sp. Ae717_Ps2]OLM28584.1 Alcohol dehydrogenase [Pseudonocardia sp. Ae717_Ps2]
MTEIPTTMRSVHVGTDHQVRVENSPVPNPAPGEVLIRSSRIGVCGSDVHAAHGRHPFIDLPYAPGHEVVGIVAALGDPDAPVTTRDSVPVTPGLRVVVEPTLPCWRCKQCQRGEENLCENLRFFGCVHHQGGMADWFTVPANRLHVVPEEFDDDQAVLIEPLATPVHAVRISGMQPGAAVAILGAGTIGLMTLAAARRAGAGRIVVTDVLESKRRTALELGADAAVDAAGPDVATAIRTELGESADVVFDCVAVQPTVDTAVSAAQKNGTVVIVGVPAAPVTVPLPIVQDQQIRIQGSATYLPADYAISTDMIRRGQVRPSDFVTGVFTLDNVAEAFEAATRGEHVKVVVTT